MSRAHKRLLLVIWLATALGLAAAQDVPRFPITRFAVEGNTLLPQGEIDRLLAPFLGPRRDFADVQHALEALEERYKAAGYTTVSVLLPEQVLESGVVRFKVIEGRIRALRFTGAQHHDEDNLRASLPTLQPGEPPLIDDVSANLRVANENPAKKFSLQLAPGQEEGAIDALVVVTDDKPWKLGATFDNTGSRQTGRTRLGLFAQHANLFNRDQVLTYQYQTSPEQPGDVKVHALSWRLPLYAWGDALDLYATDSTVNAGTLTAGPVDLAVSGGGTVFGARYTWNLPRHGAYEHEISLGLDRKRFDNRIAAGAVDLGNRIRVQPLAAFYRGRWQEGGDELSFHLGLARNLPGGAEGGAAAFARARAGAKENFLVWRGGFAASRLFESGWQMRLAATGQWSRDALVPGEQFGLGGASSVRGFDERAVANDQGWQASLELYTPELCGEAHRCRLLAFLDQGAAYRNQPLPGEATREHLASAGVGLRYAWGQQLSLQLDAGRVLDSAGETRAGDWKAHLRVSFTY